MRSIAVGHQDEITAVAYDFYGRRMATSSVDHTVKVFDKYEGSWRLSDSWRAHEAPVVKVSWAGPKYAPVLASASHDCTVRIWEEAIEEPRGSGKRWRRRYIINDFKGPLYDVEFTPSDTSLKLAAIASDGVLRVYEAMDPNNLGYWTAMSAIPLLNQPVARQLQSSFALSWSATPSFSDWIAVCVLDDALIFCWDEKANKYYKVAELPGHRGLIRDVAWAPSFGRSLGLVATACKDGYLRIFSVGMDEPRRVSEHTRTLGGASISRGADTADDSESDDDALEMGRENIKEPVEGFTVDGVEEAKPPPQAENVNVKLLHESSDHGGEVWKVAWNASGTILSSAGDDAKVRFWKSMMLGPFQCVAVVSGTERDFR